MDEHRVQFYIESATKLEDLSEIYREYIRKNMKYPESLLEKTKELLKDKKLLDTVIFLTVFPHTKNYPEIVRQFVIFHQWKLHRYVENRKKCSVFYTGIFKIIEKKELPLSPKQLCCIFSEELILRLEPTTEIEIKIKEALKSENISNSYKEILEICYKLSKNNKPFPLYREKRLKGILKKLKIDIPG